MDRRSFLATLIGGVAVVAAERTWPWRMYSFPSKINTYTQEDLNEFLASMNRLAEKYWAPQLRAAFEAPTTLEFWERYNPQYLEILKEHERRGHAGLLS